MEPGRTAGVLAPGFGGGAAVLSDQPLSQQRRTLPAPQGPPQPGQPVVASVSLTTSCSGGGIQHSPRVLGAAVSDTLPITDSLPTTNRIRRYSVRLDFFKLIPPWGQMTAYAADLPKRGDVASGLRPIGAQNGGVWRTAVVAPGFGISSAPFWGGADRVKRADGSGRRGIVHAFRLHSFREDNQKQASAQ